MTFDRQVELTADRLRGLSPSRLSAFETSFYNLLELLAGRSVPRIGSRAWADQLVVVSRDAVVPDGHRVLEFRRTLDMQLPSGE